VSTADRLARKAFFLGLYVAFAIVVTFEDLVGPDRYYAIWRKYDPLLVLERWIPWWASKLAAFLLVWLIVGQYLLELRKLRRRAESERLRPGEWPQLKN
jgi:hypothetical protein